MRPSLFPLLPMEDRVMKSVFSELQFPSKARADESIEGKKIVQGTERRLAFIEFLYDQHLPKCEPAI